AVLEDVGELVGLQVGIDRGVVEAGPIAGAAALDEALVVLHEDGVVVEPLQPLATQQVREAIAAPLELAIGDDLAAARHDEGRFVGICPCLPGWVHRLLLPVVCRGVRPGPSRGPSRGRAPGQAAWPAPPARPWNPRASRPRPCGHRPGRGCGTGPATSRARAGDARAPSAPAWAPSRRRPAARRRPAGTRRRTAPPHGCRAPGRRA